MTIDIICPLYNAEKYVDKLHENIKKQKNVKKIKLEKNFEKSIK